MTTKICKKCKQLKPVTDFRTSKMTKDGLENRCIECERVRKREGTGKTKRVSNHPKTIIQRELFSQGLRQCFSCMGIYSTDNFHRNNQASHKLSNECKKCAVERTRRHSIKKKTDDPEGWKLKDRIRSLKSNYGLSLDEYEAMLSRQDYQCEICGSTDPRNKHGVFCVDHNHITGEVRGLLCFPCNILLGRIEGNMKKLESILEYLRSYDN